MYEYSYRMNWCVSRVQVVVVSSNPERVNAAVKAIGSAAKGEVVDATKDDQVC